MLGNQVTHLNPKSPNLYSCQVSMGLVGCEVAWWLRYRWVEMDTPLAVLPSFPRSSSPSYLSRMMVELAAFLVIFDTLFYYCHRLLHTRAFYKYHKVARIPGTSSGPPLLARSRGRCYCLRSSGGSLASKPWHSTTRWTSSCTACCRWPSAPYWCAPTSLPPGCGTSSSPCTSSSNSPHPLLSIP